LSITGFQQVSRNTRYKDEQEGHCHKLKTETGIVRRAERKYQKHKRD